MGFKVIVDSGSPFTIAGITWFKKYFQSIPQTIRSSLSIESSKQGFQFGGGEVRKSLGIVTIPAYVMDDEYQAHMMCMYQEGFK